MHARATRVSALALLAICAASPIVAAGAKDIYVDGAGGRATNTGSRASPVKDLYQALARAVGGDTVHLLPTTTYSELAIQKSGLPVAPITIAGDGVAPNQTKVTGSGGNFGVWIDGSYLVVRNLDVTAPGNWAGIYVNGGRHHVMIANNTVHGAGNDGISTYRADYVTIESNTVYGNGGSTTSGIFGSGISLYESADIDASRGVKMVVEHNLVYRNSNRPACASGCTDSDGNGIIVDDGRHTQSDNVAYHGRTLVTDNIVYNNGGRGVDIYESDHVTVSQNTLYMNNQDPYEANYRPGEVTVDDGGDISVTLNILVSDGGVGIDQGLNTGRHVCMSYLYNTVGTLPIVATGNLVWTTGANRSLISYVQQNTIPVVISNNIFANPAFRPPA